jgi:hypothetical protein
VGRCFDSCLNKSFSRNSAPYLREAGYSSSQILGTVTKTTDEAAVMKALEDSNGWAAFGLWAPTPRNSTIFYSGRAETAGRWLFSPFTGSSIDDMVIK